MNALAALPAIPSTPPALRWQHVDAPITDRAASHAPRLTTEKATAMTFPTIRTEMDYRMLTKPACATFEEYIAMIDAFAAALPDRAAAKAA
jgi:hypothetical protein